MTTSLSFAYLFNLDRLTTLLFLVGLAKSSAILSQIPTFCSLAKRLSSCMRNCRCGFVGPVTFAILFCDYEMRRAGFEPAHPLMDWTFEVCFLNPAHLTMLCHRRMHV